MKLFVTECLDGKKCGGCNWETSMYYGIGKTKKDARSNFNEDKKEYGHGLCAECICQLMIDNKANIEGVQ